MKKVALWSILAAIAFAVAWTSTASYLFLYGTRLLPYYPGTPSLWQWWNYALNAPPNAAVRFWLWAAAIPPAVVLALLCAVCVRMGLRLRVPAPSLKREPGDRQLIRGVTDNHGHADWMSIEAAQALFPGPHGVIVGEAYRVDLDSVRGVPFSRTDRSTWGMGGKAPLLIDPCTDGPTHGITFAGPGGYKTTSAVSSLVHPQGWRGSCVVLDPSCELGAMARAAREAMGHEVITLGPGDEGPNVLDWIDPKDKLAETNVHALVALIYKEPERNGEHGSDRIFDPAGRNLIACLLADMLWDDTISREEKTLRRLRAGVVTPESQMRVLLRAIHATSKSTMARHLAGSVMELVSETFSGVYFNATQGTGWLSVQSYATLVSGSAFKLTDLAAGKLSVFVQVPLKALQATPAIARVLIGSMMNACFEADGKMNGRVLFDLDEAAQLGPMQQLAVARDTGRKYGITLRLWFQSVGQMEGIWGREGRRAWYDSVSWRAYAVIGDPDIAEELSKTIGEYGVMATSEGDQQGRSTNAGGLGFGTRNRGSNKSHHEISRRLVRPEEIIADMRADEMVMIVRGGGALRCGRPICFRRPEIADKIGVNRF